MAAAPSLNQLYMSERAQQRSAITVEDSDFLFNF